MERFAAILNCGEIKLIADAMNDANVVSRQEHSITQKDEAKYQDSPHENVH